MTLFHRLILRMLPGPFLGWLGLLMFLLLMQFLIRYLPDLVGKGLPVTVVLELVAYSLAYMVVLAVPMSVLIATLMTFGRLAETRAYAVIKSAGISLPQMLWPVLLIGMMLTGGMWYFNNVVLPEANFRAKNLWIDIRRKKPGFELQAGIFYEGINNYSILVHDLPTGTNDLVDVTIYDYSEGSNKRVDIKAQRGRLETRGNGDLLELVLFNGEIHRRRQGTPPNNTERYERLAFGRHRLELDLADFAFERSDPNDTRRSDRTMRTAEMIVLVDSLEENIVREKERLREMTLSLLADSTRRAVPETPPLPLPAAAEADINRTTYHRIALAGLPVDHRRETFDLAVKNARRTRTQVDNARRSIQWSSQRADRHRVEIHKKYSIAVACLIFVLVGAPLGLSIRRGGLGTAAGLAVGLFLFYWVTLVQGEKLADRDLLTPWVGMWAANVLTFLVGAWLVLYTTLDLRATPPLRRRLWEWLRPGNRPAVPALPEENLDPEDAPAPH